MGKPTGFLEYERKDGPVTAPKKRIENFSPGLPGFLVHPDQESKMPRTSSRGAASAGSALHGMRRSLLPGGYNDCRNGFGMPAA